MHKCTGLKYEPASTKQALLTFDILHLPSSLLLPSLELSDTQVYEP